MSEAPALRCWPCWAPKKGHTAAEYEDALAMKVEARRFAVADGASESSYAGLWAQHLVGAFVHAPGPAIEGWRQWLPSARQAWAGEVGDGPLPWYAEAKRTLGAFATFLGLELDGTGWRALAAGDSCLVHVRGEEAVCRFPLTNSADFSNAPVLLGSRGPGLEALAGRFVTAGGACRSGDSFWLMTDALAQWFFRELEARRRPWIKLAELLVGPDLAGRFQKWVEGERTAGKLRNDDTTLSVISVL